MAHHHAEMWTTYEVYPGIGLCERQQTIDTFHIWGQTTWSLDITRFIVAYIIYICIYIYLHIIYIYLHIIYIYIQIDIHICGSNSIEWGSSDEFCGRDWHSLFGQILFQSNLDFAWTCGTVDCPLARGRLYVTLQTCLYRVI